MVDAERVGARLDRLEHLIERLDAVRARGEAAYFADEGLRAMTERWLQLAIQVCIDLGAQLVSELSVPPPTDYAGVFAALGEAGSIDSALAEQLATAARQRNLLVHAYLDTDDRQVLAALDRLDDMRDFAAAVQRVADEG
ncbi:MAG: DUF86 domain-containing protein [Actinomycetota bacterium]|nr:DUF86 domain-containing protein [Actinomycetota bacterium]